MGPQPQESEEIEEFDREFASEKEAVAALEKHYDADRVQGWLGSRVRRIAGGGVWSDVNPQAQRLARANVLACDAASSNWDALASHKALPFPVHLWVAGPEAFGGTVTDWDGRWHRDMQKRLPSVQVREFVEGATASTTPRRRNSWALLAVVDDAATGGRRRAAGAVVSAPAVASEPLAPFLAGYCHIQAIRSARAIRLGLYDTTSLQIVELIAAVI